MDRMRADRDKRDAYVRTLERARATLTQSLEDVSDYARRNELLLDLSLTTTVAAATRAGGRAGSSFRKASTKEQQHRAFGDCPRRGEEGPRARRAERGTCHDRGSCGTFASYKKHFLHRHDCKPKFGISRPRWTRHERRHSTSSGNEIGLSGSCSALRPLTPRLLRRPRLQHSTAFPVVNSHCGPCRRTGRSTPRQPRH